MGCWGEGEWPRRDEVRNEEEGVEGREGRVGVVRKVGVQK